MALLSLLTTHFSHNSVGADPPGRRTIRAPHPPCSSICGTLICTTLPCICCARTLLTLLRPTNHMLHPTCDMGAPGQQPDQG